jgi:phage gp37-like protein
MSLTLGQLVGRLEEEVVDLVFDGMPYVKTVRTYNGELGDRAKLAEALKALKNEFPLVLVAYSGGEDVEWDGSREPNAPRDKQHEATLTVVCCADDLRHQYVRNRGQSALTRKDGQALSHRMMSDVRDILDNRQLTTEVDGEEAILNVGQLDATGNDYVERITGVTAIAVSFSCAFAYTTPDHSAEPSGEIAKINFSVGSSRGPADLRYPPGIHPSE